MAYHAVHFREEEFKIRTCIWHVLGDILNLDVPGGILDMPSLSRRIRPLGLPRRYGERLTHWNESTNSQLDWTSELTYIKRCGYNTLPKSRNSKWMPLMGMVPINVQCLDNRPPPHDHLVWLAAPLVTCLPHSKLRATCPLWQGPKDQVLHNIITDRGRGSW